MKTSHLFRNTGTSRALIAACALTVAALLSFAPVSAEPVPSAGAQSQANIDGNGSMLAARVVLIARPLDSNHEITAVRFLLDGATLAECGPPGRFVWDTSGLRPGRHVVQVQGFDGERFIGLSEPFVVYTGQSNVALSKSFDVPFYTYEPTRRTTAVVAPRLSVRAQASGARIPESGDIASGRLATALIEVYLNGVKQEFAPAARLASTEEMTSAVSPGGKTRDSVGKKPVRKTVKRVAKGNMKNAVEAQRTVWLPARPLLERLGARIVWQSREQTMVAVLNVAGAPRRIYLSAKPGRGAQAEVAGHRISLATPVRLADNALMVPLEFCREALDLRVRWQKETRRVEMFTPISPA